MNEYPKWLFHAKLEAKVVNDPEAEKLLTKRGYVTHPDLLDAPIPHKPVK